jgi:tripartite-type tricarboxylate transporter receptor subunit TctC
VPVAVDVLDTLLPQHEAGKVRILASSGAKRSAIAPNVPTFRESGIELVAAGWNAFFAPASLPKDRAERYASAIVEIMREPETQKKFLDARMSPVAANRAQTQAMLKAYRAQWAPVVQKSGYQP